MFKSLLACGILAASVGVQAGTNVTMFCPKFDNSIVHLEHTKKGNKAEMVFENGEFTLFDIDGGSAKTSLRDIYYVKAIGKSGVTYKLSINVYPVVKKVVIGVFENGSVIDSETCELLQTSKF